jgi:hypothetical protein
MRKSILASGAAVLCLALVSAPSYAASAAMAKMTCDDASMAKMETDMTAMAAGKKKTMATKEMGMAKDAMGKHKMKACASHMTKAGKAMM